MKKLIAALSAVLVMFASTLGCVTAGAVGATTGEVDVVFLVDSSLSMKTSDPDSIRTQAIDLFADLCTLGSTKIGFVLFGSDINYSQEPIDINTEEDRKKIKETTAALGNYVKGATDTGRAALYAVDMLASDAYTGNGKFIVFLSDGKTDVGRNKEGRTLEASKADLTSAIIEARNAGIPIYTIGLDAGGEADEAELQYISSSTYADKTYMTKSSSELSEILSEIYVHHTGAENNNIISYVSDGEERDVTFGITDSSVVEANLVVMHSGGLDDIKLYGADGNPVLFDGAAADISRSDKYSLVKIYCPSVGDWRITLRSPKETQIDINCILTRDYNLDLGVLSDKPIGNGTRLKFEAVLTDPEKNPVTDENLIKKLVGRIIVKNEDAGTSVEIPLEYVDMKYKGEAVLDADAAFTVQASLYNSNIDIRSEIMTLPLGDESIVEPEGPLKLILMIAGGAVLLILLIVIIIKKLKENIRMWSGRLVLTVNTGGMPFPPAYFDFAKKIPGKRKVMLSSVMSAAFEKGEASDAIPKSITAGIKITMTESGDIRVAKVGGIEYSGGITLGKNIILSNANRLTLRYKDKTGTTNTLIIQYMRT